MDFKALQTRAHDAPGNLVEFRSLAIAAGAVSLGFKSFKHTARWELDGFVEEVTTLRHMERMASEYGALLPRIHYEVRDGEEPVGILTEDFTRGGKLLYLGSMGLTFGEFAGMFSRPGVIDDDHEAGVMGRFYDRDTDTSIKRVIDVTPIYQRTLFVGRFDEEYPDWFREETRMDEVAARINELRIDVAELAAA